MTSTIPKLRILRGDLLDFTEDPGFALPGEAPGVRWRPDHRVLIQDGRIQAVLPPDMALPPEWAGVPEEVHPGRLIMPGFIDTHVHCPQLDVIASFGTELLDWLNTYTFPAERRYADPAVSREGAHRFLNALWAHGTTSAVVFPTVHKVSAEALFEAAHAAQMRLVTGNLGRATFKTSAVDRERWTIEAPARVFDSQEAVQAAFKAGEAAPAYPSISDDEIRETLEKNQIRLLKERGADITIFSPRASAMAPHVGDESVAIEWARRCNDLIARVVGLFPDVFAGVCMLPQSPKADMQGSIEELERCVTELGFIGCNLNPDPGGGHFQLICRHTRAQARCRQVCVTDALQRSLSQQTVKRLAASNIYRRVQQRMGKRHVHQLTEVWFLVQ